MRPKLGYAGGHIKKLLALLVLLPGLTWACGYNGSGQYVRCFNWTQDAQNGIPITASRFDTEDNGFAQGLSSVMTLNGQSTVTANLPMSGFYFTNVGNAIATTNFAAAGQVQNNEFNYGVENGSTANTYVVGNGNVIPAALQSGQLLWFKPPVTNTGASTLNWDTLGAIPILKNGTSALSAADLISGTWYGVTYDAAVNAWVPISPVGNAGTPDWYNILRIPLQVQNVSNSTNISMTNIQISNSLAVSGSAAFLSGLSVAGDITASGRTITAATVTATAVNTGALSATTISMGGVSLTSLLPLQVAVFNGNGACTKIGTGVNFSGCTRIAAGKYGVSPSVNFASSSYAVNCGAENTKNQAFPQVGTLNSDVSASVTGYIITTGTEAAGNADNGRVSCIVTNN